MGRKLKVEVKELYVEENGFFEDKKDEMANCLAAEWHFPKIGVPSVQSILNLKLKDQLCYFIIPENTVQELFPEAIGDKLEALKRQFEWDMENQRILFKQEIEGDSFLELNVSAVYKTDKFDKILMDVLGIAAKGAFNLIPWVGSVGKEIGGKVVDSLFEGWKPDDKKLKSIGKCIIKVSENIKFPEGKKSYVTNKIPLLVPKEVEIKYFKYEIVPGTYKVQEIKKDPLILKKGAINGYIVLEITDIG